jgi:hypothetical protein
MGRWWRYARLAYPPAMSLLLAVLWALGVTGLFATVDPEAAGWRPDAETAVAALTLALNLLLLRIIDDIRDLGYDRAHYPGRPLPAGVVRVADLLTLYGVGAVIILALNAGRGAALLIIAGQLLYALALLASHHWLHWPDGDRVVVTMLVSSPVQVLLHLYLYTGYLRSVGQPADASAWVGLLAVVFASLHLELAKKITRAPAPAERTYVRVWGLWPTVVVAMLGPVLSVVILLLAANPAVPAWAYAAPIATLALPGIAAARFLPGPRKRWDARLAVFYLLVSFAAWLVTGLAVAGR